MGFLNSRVSFPNVTAVSCQSPLDELKARRSGQSKSVVSENRTRKAGKQEVTRGPSFLGTNGTTGHLQMMVATVSNDPRKQRAHCAREAPPTSHTLPLKRRSEKLRYSSHTLSQRRQP